MHDFDKYELERIVNKHSYRNGVQHPDGSMGTVEVTPKQFRDAIDEAFELGRNALFDYEKITRI